MKIIRALSILAAMVLLSSCGRSGTPSTSACVQRPSDEQIQTAVNSIFGSASSPIQLLGVNVSCNTGAAIYQQPGATTVASAQMIATDNGKWFVFNGFNGTQITQ